MAPEKHEKNHSLNDLKNKYEGVCRPVYGSKEQVKSCGKKQLPSRGHRNNDVIDKLFNALFRGLPQVWDPCRAHANGSIAGFDLANIG